MFCTMTTNAQSISPKVKSTIRNGYVHYSAKMETKPNIAEFSLLTAKADEIPLSIKLSKPTPTYLREKTSIALI